MKYRVNEELSIISLALTSEEENQLVFDRVEFPVAPRDSLRRQWQKELKEIAQQEADITADCLLKYSGLEKFADQFYLVRQHNLTIGLEVFSIVSLEQSCRVLLRIIAVLKIYRQQGLVLGGLSLGQLKQGRDGRFYLQDPLLLNHLSKSLAKEYRVDAPPEVLRGSSWNQQSDLFSWGVLAFRLLTGEDPFGAVKTEERLAKILKIGAISPKDIKPELSPELSQLITACLNNDPRKRPDLDELAVKLQQLVAESKLTVSAAAAEEYRDKAKVNLRYYQKREQFWFWFRKYGVATLSTIGIICFFTFFWLGTKSKPVITARTKPAKVLAYYFQGVTALDVSLIDETLHHAKNSFEEIVINLFVLNKTQQGMEQSLRNNYVHLELLNLTLEPLSAGATQVKYLASYTLKITLPQEIQYYDRKDIFTLKPFWRVWRIAKIDILKEKTWTEKVTTPKIPDNYPPVLDRGMGSKQLK